MENETKTTAAVFEAPTKGIIKYRKGTLGRYPSVDYGVTGKPLLGRIPSVDCGERCIEEVMDALLGTPEPNGNNSKPKASPASQTKVSSE